MSTLPSGLARTASIFLSMIPLAASEFSKLPKCVSGGREEGRGGRRGKEGGERGKEGGERGKGGKRARIRQWFNEKPHNHISDNEDSVFSVAMSTTCKVYYSHIKDMCPFVCCYSEKLDSDKSRGARLEAS